MQKIYFKLHDKGMPEILKHLYGINVCVCKICGGKLGKPQLRMATKMLNVSFTNSFLKPQA